jgi:alkylmercury lyase
MKEPGTTVGTELLAQAVRQTIATIPQIKGYELFPYMWRLRGADAPVPVDRLAAAVGWSVEQVREILRAHPAEWDDHGRLVGFGMTLRPTPHKFTLEGRTVYGWCASDTLMFPVLLGKPGLVESVCPATREPVRVTVAPDEVRSVDPREAVVSAVRPDRRVENVRTEICHLGHFFSSREAAAVWLEANPQGMLHTVEEDSEIHRRAVEQQTAWSARGQTAC